MSNRVAWTLIVFGSLFVVTSVYFIFQSSQKLENKRPSSSNQVPDLKAPEKPKIEEKPLEIRESGFTQDKESDTVSIGATIYNHNKYSALSVHMIIKLYNSQGKIVGNAVETIDTIPPETEAVLGTDLTLSNESARAKKIEIRAEPERYEEPIEPFPIDDLKVSQSEIATTTTGEISNPYNKDLNDVEVFVVFQDSDSKLMGGGFTFIDFMPANSRSGFKIDSVVALPEANQAKAFATITDQTELKSIIGNNNK